jgi:hypothetical protein
MEATHHTKFMQLAFAWSLLWGLGSRLTTGLFAAMRGFKH